MTTPERFATVFSACPMEPTAIPACLLDPVSPLDLLAAALRTAPDLAAVPTVATALRARAIATLVAVCGGPRIWAHLAETALAIGRANHGADPSPVPESIGGVPWAWGLTMTIGDPSPDDAGALSSSLAVVPAYTTDATTALRFAAGVKGRRTLGRLVDAWLPGAAAADVPFLLQCAQVADLMDRALALLVELPADRLLAVTAADLAPALSANETGVRLHALRLLGRLPHQTCAKSGVAAAEGALSCASPMT